MTHVHHVTLTTGHSRRSYREEVADAVVTECQQLIERALESPQHVPVPNTDGCSITASAEGRALIVTLWGPPTEIRGSPPQRPPLVTVGVATHSRHGAKLWRLLHHSRGAELRTDVERCPPEPWLAARIEIGAAFMPEAMTWIGDFERCIAWAWIEREHEN